MSIIEDLCRTLISRWRVKGYAEWEFAAIAATVLDEFTLHEHVDRLFDHVFTDSEGSLVRDHRSRDVACLYSGAYFSVYLHTWINGLAAMHHHSWSGAYQVLHGSSVEGRYSFENEHRFAASFSVGRLECKAVGDLSAGNIRIVEPGPSNIHAVSYSDPTSLAISIRSGAIAGETTMDYWRPGVATETGGVPDYVKARNRCLQYLSSDDPRKLVRRLRDWISSCDLRTVFWGLEAFHSWPRRISPTEWSDLAKAGRAAHGSIFDTIAAAARDTQRPAYYRRLLARIPADDRELRRFLSNLFVCLDRCTLLGRLQTVLGTSASIDRFVEWCQQIFLLDSDGYQDDNWQSELLPIIEGFVASGSAEGTLDYLVARYEIEDETVELVRQACANLRAHPVIGALGGPFADRIGIV